MILTDIYKADGSIVAQPGMFVPIGNGLEVRVPDSVQEGDTWDIIVEPLVTPTKLKSTYLGNSLLIASSQENLSELCHNTLHSPNRTQDTVTHATKPERPVFNFRATAIQEYYSHIFVAVGRTLYWTDVDEIWNWYPSRENEADFHTFDAEPDDITGIVRVNDMLYVHFPNAVYLVEYVGKPTIVRIRRMLDSIGAVAPGTLIAHNSTQFFIGPDDFYLVSTQNMQPIGTAIWENFLSRKPDIHSIWSYVDQKNYEICWVVGDVVFAFNYQEGHFTKYSTDSTTAHVSIPTSQNERTIATFTFPSGSKLDHNPADDFMNVWLVGDVLAREFKTKEGLVGVLPQGECYLESDDFDYGDLHQMKEVDLVVVDGQHSNQFVQGLRVFISARDGTEHGEYWKDAGLWDRFKKLNQADTLLQSGRTLRFRFQVQSNHLTFNGQVWNNGGMETDGVQRQRWDNQFVFDGEVDCKPRHLMYFDGSNQMNDETYYNRTNYLRMHGWGERVKLPEVLIGPDK